MWNGWRDSGRQQACLHYRLGSNESSDWMWRIAHVLLTEVEHAIPEQ